MDEVRGAKEERHFTVLSVRWSDRRQSWKRCATHGSKGQNVQFWGWFVVSGGGVLRSRIDYNKLSRTTPPHPSEHSGRLPLVREGGRRVGLASWLVLHTPECTGRVQFEAANSSYPW